MFSPTITQLGIATIVFGASTFTFSCPIGDSDSLNLHLCNSNVSSDWAGHDLRFYHDIPRTCPVELYASGHVETFGGAIVDDGLQEFDVAYLDIFDGYGTNLGSDAAPFFFGTANLWQAYTYTWYCADRFALGGGYYDWGRYKLKRIDNQFGWPEAYVYVTYNVENPGYPPECS